MSGASEDGSSTAPRWLSRWRNWVRGALFLALLAQIWGGPFARQVLHARHPSTRQWTMFSLKGLGIMAVEYRVRAADGTERVLDRYALLGHTAARNAPRSVRRIENPRQAFQVARRLCKALQNRPQDPVAQPDVRLHARKSTRRGWKVAVAGEQNVCVAKLPDRPHKKRKKKRARKPPRRPRTAPTGTVAR